MDKFNKELVAHRKAQGLSYYKAALCCGLSWGSYGKIEQGGGLTLGTLKKLSKGLDLTFTIKNGEIIINK